MCYFVTNHDYRRPDVLLQALNSEFNRSFISSVITDSRVLIILQGHLYSMRKQFPHKYAEHPLTASCTTPASQLGMKVRGLGPFFHLCK